jgi:ribosomal protein S18 acetylase RimI-like enzyme
MDREYCALVYRAFVERNIYCNQPVKEDKSRLVISQWLPDARRQGIVKPVTILKTNQLKNPYYNYIMPSYDQQFDKQEDLLQVLQMEIIPEFKEYAYSIMVHYHDSEQMKQAFITLLQQRFSLSLYDSIAMVLPLTDEICRINGKKLETKHPQVSHIRVANTCDLVREHKKFFINALGHCPSESALQFFSQIEPNNPMVHRIDVIGHNDQIIATGDLIHNPEEKYAFFDEIGVAPDFRKCGLGEYVTRLLIQESIQRKADICLLNATEMGKCLYEKIGFSNVGHITYVQQTFWD